MNVLNFRRMNTYFTRLKIFVHTVRYLKFIQIRYQLIFRIKRRLFAMGWFGKRIRHVDSPEPIVAALHIRPSPPISVDLEQKRFNFLNHPVAYSQKMEWNDPRQEKLWLYHLHYFDYLLPLTEYPNEKNFLLGKDIIQDWIRQNPVGHSNGWEPYPISLRLVNWGFFYSFFHPWFEADAAFRREFLNSLFRQFCYLEYFIEYHLMANHLFANLKALVWASLFFQQRKKFKKYTTLLLKQIEEQVLEDGGHFERSPTYHAVILLDVLDLLNLLRAAPEVFSRFPGARELESRLTLVSRKMLDWLFSLLHTDGEIPLFGDSAFAAAPNPVQIKTYYENILEQTYQPPQFQFTFLPTSGYAVFAGQEQKLILDAGELGVSYQPGHAHCDLTSFEYSYAGKRFIVDSGVGNYLPGELRQKARSIWSHNTVVVDDLDQAELWQAFRMGRRVHAPVTEVKEQPEEVTFTVAYQNNLDRTKAYTHQRTIRLVQNSFFVVEDRVQTKRPLEIVSLLHLHPDVKVEMGRGGCVLRQGRERVMLLWNPGEMSAEIRTWFYVPEFGKILESKLLVFHPSIEKQCVMYYVIAPEQHVQQAKWFLERRMEQEER